MFFPEKYNISVHILHGYCGCDFFLLRSSQSLTAASVKNRHLRSMREKMELYLVPALCTSGRIITSPWNKGRCSRDCSAGPLSFWAVKCRIIQKQEMEHNERVPLKWRLWLYTLDLWEKIQIELVYKAGKMLILHPVLNKELQITEAFMWIFIWADDFNVLSVTMCIFSTKSDI